MQMTEGLDAGDMLTKAETVISAQDNSQLLHDRLSNMGAELLLTTLDELERGDLSPQQQDEALVTYAPKINKSDALIDWRQSAVEIVRKVQAFYGWPVAYSHFNGEVMRIWQAVGSIESSEEAPGTLYLAGKNQLAVSCGEGCLYLEKIQLPGKKVMTAVDFINANRDFEKEQLS